MLGYGVDGNFFNLQSYAYFCKFRHRNQTDDAALIDINFLLRITSICSLAPINIAICVRTRRSVFDDGDKFLSETACVLRPLGDPKMCPG